MFIKFLRRLSVDCRKYLPTIYFIKTTVECIYKKNHKMKV